MLHRDVRYVEPLGRAVEADLQERPHVCEAMLQKLQGKLLRGECRRRNVDLRACAFFASARAAAGPPSPTYWIEMYRHPIRDFRRVHEAPRVADVIAAIYYSRAVCQSPVERHRSTSCNHRRSLSAPSQAGNALYHIPLLTTDRGP